MLFKNKEKWLSLMALVSLASCGKDEEGNEANSADDAPETSETMTLQGQLTDPETVTGLTQLGLTNQGTEVDVSGLQVKCIALTTMVATAAPVGADGTFNLENFPNDEAVGCFVVDANSKPVATMVYPSTVEDGVGETNAESDTQVYDESLGFFQPVNLGAVPLDLQAGTATIKPENIRALDGSEIELGNFVKNARAKAPIAKEELYDMTGVWKMVKSPYDMNGLEDGVCSVDELKAAEASNDEKEANSCRENLEGMGIYLHRVEGLVKEGHPKLKAGKSVFGLQVWGGSATETGVAEPSTAKKGFEICGSKLGISPEQAQYLDFAQSGLALEPYTWGTKINVNGTDHDLTDVEVRKRRDGTPVTAKIGSSAWECPNTEMAPMCHMMNYYKYAMADNTNCLPMWDERHEFKDNRASLSKMKPVKPLRRFMFERGHYLGKNTYRTAERHFHLEEFEEGDQRVVCPVIRENKIQMTAKTQDGKEMMLVKFGEMMRLDHKRLDAMQKGNQRGACMKHLNKERDRVSNEVIHLEKVTQ